MANKTGHDPTVAGRIKIGTPRRSKPKRGNAPAKTAKCGNGRKLR